LTEQIHDCHSRRTHAKEKAVVDSKIEAAQEERGVLVVNTGNGKGKSSAAFGVVARPRAWAQGRRRPVRQRPLGHWRGSFFASSRTSPGTWAAKDLPGKPRTRNVTPRAAQAAWEIACGHLSDPSIGLVVLDEMTYAFKYGWLDLDAILAKLLARPAMQHVIITGRAAPQALREAADTVSDIGMEKHAFQSGIKAMPGLEF
jgi:cob(I)alamin adenosyltransferase